ncbi:ubiquitin-conjugating enzyme E2 variant 1C [Platysternon megacephalum]|uniref:Ubiquitin-conjugating enzyme E2 variant 1C n=1 Tax=Platysternon megacephalum TaxID=55544 RepID=A0A4D9DG64_9SAUR|nr:ubiquitin-conjugating enzyme E2 variant 1C [Platysternon megacephalum]
MPANPGARLAPYPPEVNHILQHEANSRRRFLLLNNLIHLVEILIHSGLHEGRQRYPSHHHALPTPGTAACQGPTAPCATAASAASRGTGHLGESLTPPGEQEWRE